MTSNSQLALAQRKGLIQTIVETVRGPLADRSWNGKYTHSNSALSAGMDGNVLGVSPVCGCHGHRLGTDWQADLMEMTQETQETPDMAWSFVRSGGGI